MKRCVALLSLAGALGLFAPTPATAGDCGGPGCALAIATGVGGSVFAGILLVPVGLETFYLAKDERPPLALPIVSFVFVSILIFPTVVMWVAADRTAEPSFFGAGAAFTAAASGALVLGVVSLLKEDRTELAGGPRWALTPTFGETRGAALTLVGF